MGSTRLREAADELVIGFETRVSGETLADLLTSIANWQDAAHRLDRKTFEHDVLIDANLLAGSILDFVTLGAP
jgi:hypothetical protein